MPHQVQALKFCMSKQYPGLFMDMRLRKNSVIIRTIKLWQCQRILITGPYSVFSGWIGDLEIDRENSVSVLSGNRKSCLKKLNPLSRWTLINKEGYTRIPEIAKINWDCVVIDESTSIKNPKPAITKFYLENFRETKHRVIMTGYPDPNSLLDYICQLNFLDPNILKMSYWKFRHVYCSNPAPHLWIVKTNGKEFLQKKISKNCFTMRREEAGFKCEKIFKTRIIPMPAEIRKIYNELVNYLILNDLSGEEVKKTVHGIASFSWLRRLCGGFIEKKLQQGVFDFVFPEKLLELRYLMQGEFKNESVLIACNFIEEVCRVGEMLSEIGITHNIIYGKIKPAHRDIIISNFVKGKNQVTVCQPSCLRMGMNLSHCSTIIDYSITPGETYNQFHDRTIDLDKTASSLVLSLLVEKTIDIDLYKSAQKREISSVMFRRIIRSIQK